MHQLTNVISVLINTKSEKKTFNISKERYMSFVMHDAIVKIGLTVRKIVQKNVKFSGLFITYACHICE